MSIPIRQQIMRAVFIAGFEWEKLPPDQYSIDPTIFSVANPPKKPIVFWLNDAIGLESVALAFKLQGRKDAVCFHPFKGCYLNPWRMDLLRSPKHVDLDIRAAVARAKATHDRIVAEIRKHPELVMNAVDKLKGKKKAKETAVDKILKECRTGRKEVVEGWLRNMNKDTNGTQKQMVARLEALLRNQVWMQR